MKTNYLTNEEKLKLAQEKKVLEYCEVETIEETKKILSEIKLEYKIINFEKKKDSNYFSLKIKVTLSRNNKNYTFDFYGSHNDATFFYKELFILQKENRNISINEREKRIQKGRDNFHHSFLYTILCDCKMNIQTNLSSFKNFCNEFGYNIDSIKDRDLYLFCLDHKDCLLNIFTEEEAEFLPN